MDPYNKSFKVEVGEGRSMVFICRIRSVQGGCYDFFKGMEVLHLEVRRRRQQKKKVAKTRKCDGLEGSGIPEIHRLLKKPALGY